MARGIWKNSLIKIFLTRSIVGAMFRPLLYSPKENIHYNFLEAIRTETAPIFLLKDLKSRGLAYYWLFDVPKAIFEELFLSDTDEQAAACTFDFAETKDGSKAAYLTQGYIWYYIEYLLKAKDSIIAPHTKDFEFLAEYLSTVFASDSKPAYYRDYFTRLAESYAEGAFEEEAARQYIIETIKCLGYTKNADFSIKPDFIKICSHKCNWKLENAKYTTITMLNRWE